jgi:hypothetical protein
MPEFSSQTVVINHANIGTHTVATGSEIIKDSHNVINTCKEFENRWKRDLKIAIERCIIVKQIQDSQHDNQHDDMSISNLLDELHTKTAILMASPLINSNAFLQTFPISKFGPSNSLSLSGDSDNAHLFDTQHANIFIARLVNILGFYNKKNVTVGEPIKDQDINDELSVIGDDEESEEFYEEEEEKPEPLNQNEYNILLESIVLSDSNNKIKIICDDVCSVCLEPYNIGDQLKQTVCNHYFHDECLKEWFNSENGSVFCPVCRTNQREGNQENSSSNCNLTNNSNEEC